MATLKQRIKKRGIRMEDVAKESGLSAPTVSRYFLGMGLRYGNAARVKAAALRLIAKHEERVGSAGNGA